MDPRTATILKALAVAGACGGVGYAVYRTVRKPAAAAAAPVPASSTPPPQLSLPSSALKPYIASTSDPEYRSVVQSGYAKGAADRATHGKWDDRDPYTEKLSPEALADVLAYYALENDPDGWQLVRSVQGDGRDRAQLDMSMRISAWKEGYLQGFYGEFINSTEVSFPVWSTSIPYVRASTGTKAAQPKTAGVGHVRAHRHATHGCAGSPGLELSSFAGRTR